MPGMTRIMGWLACAGAVLLLVVAMATGTAPANAAPRAMVRVSDAVVELPIVPGRPAAGFAVITATAPAELVEVASPVARVELHSTTMTGGVMHMGALPRLPIVGRVALRHGGTHLMLFDLTAGLHAGATVPLTFAFADGASVTVAAAVTRGAR